jgi:hypothetical protein
VYSEKTQDHLNQVEDGNSPGCGENAHPEIIGDANQTGAIYLAMPPARLRAKMESLSPFS